jgi:TolB-like protein
VRLRFGSFSFEATVGALSRDGAAVPIGLRAAKLLAVLLAHRGETVGKDALMEAAWPGQAVEESNLTVQMAALRKALGTTSQGHEWIVTVPRLGYRFISADNSETKADAGKPSIAVLPFANLSSDAEQDYFAAGLADDLITDLSKVQGLLVISRDSSFAFKDTTEPDAIARQLGVQYLVRGSVRRAADKVRINAWLIDAAEHSPIWADRFDGDLADIFALQDQVVGKIVAALAGVLPRGVVPKPRRQPNLEAYDVFVKGRQIALESPKGNYEARALLTRAAELDPQFAEPHAWLAMTYVQGWLTFGHRVKGSLANAVAAGRRAVERDPQNADAHAFLGYALGFDKKPDEAAAEMSTALGINPNHADAMALHSELLVNAGRTAEAVEIMQKAMRLNPYPPFWYRWVFGFDLYADGRYEDVVDVLEHETLRGTGAGRLLAAGYAQLGRVDDARTTASEFLQLVPSFSIREWIRSQPLTDETVRDRFIEGYRRAGLPD